MSGKKEPWDKKKSTIPSVKKKYGGVKELAKNFAEKDL